MMAAPESGFVFLATTKTGSTAIENKFARYAQIAARRRPSLKHINVRAFNYGFAPILARHGYPSSSYELICVVREPVDWAVSWWRYRSRPDAEGTKSFTGTMSFDEFAERIVAGEVDLGDLTKFVTRVDGTVGIDRMWRYENIERMAEWMASKIGIPTPPLQLANVSPGRRIKVAATTRARLLEHYADHLAFYESAL